MQKKVKMLAAIVCAAAWWSVFYPELCFTEETCQLIQTAAEDGAANTGLTKEAEKAGQGAAVQNRETDTAAGIMRAGEDEVVISSRFLEWCEKNLFDRME